MMGSHFFGKSKIVLLGSKRRKRRRRRRKKWHFFPPLLFGEGKRGEEEKYTPPLILLHRFSPRVSIVLFVFFWHIVRWLSYFIYVLAAQKRNSPREQSPLGKKTNASCPRVSQKKIVRRRKGYEAGNGSISLSGSRFASSPPPTDAQYFLAPQKVEDAAEEEEARGDFYLPEICFSSLSLGVEVSCWPRL